MPDEADFETERLALVRSLRHHLESLRRAGVEWVPNDRGRDMPPVGPVRPARASRETPLRVGVMPAGSTPVVARPALGQAVAGPAAPGPAFASRPGSPGELGTHAQPPGASPAPPGASTAPPAAAGPHPAKAPLLLPLATVAPPVNSPVTLPLAAAGSLFGASDFDIPPVPASDRPAMLATLAAEVAVCRRCTELAETRTQTVFGVGTHEARLMFIGEAPGGEEDRQGEPFVGRAGQLLTDMITKGMGLSRGQVYIANILKCRPPENRTPSPEECINCVGYLEQQIAIIRPEFICMLGLEAAQTLLETTQSLGRLRGRWHSYRGIRTIVTYHPAYLLRSPSFKKQAWEDLQTLMKAMGLPLPNSRGRS